MQIRGMCILPIKLPTRTKTLTSSYYFDAQEAKL